MDLAAVAAGAQDTQWEVVWATLVGPIIGAVIALWITHWRESIVHKKQERVEVFKALMSTRSMPINTDHVRALNLIEVTYYGVKNVSDAWKAYHRHLNTPSNVDNSRHWHDETEKLLTRLLYEMGKHLGYDIPELDIYRGGYHPSGWEHRDQMQTRTLRFLSELADGRARVPMTVYLENPPAPASEQPTTEKKANASTSA